MGNKGGYILTSLAKDKTQIISDLVLFMDFVSVANSAVVGEFLSCILLVPYTCQCEFIAGWIELQQPCKCRLRRLASSRLLCFVKVQFPGIANWQLVYEFAWNFNGCKH